MIITDDNCITIGTGDGAVQCWDQETEEVFDRYDSAATRKIVCAWSNRAKLMAALNPGATTEGGITVFGAQAYPDFNHLFPQRFRIKGAGTPSVGPNGLIAYQYAIVTAEYRPFKGGDLTIDTGANVITLPRSGPCLESDEDNPVDVPFQDTPGKPIAVINLCQGRNNVPVLPMAIIRDIATNPINADEFAGYAPGTVLFEGGRARRLNLSSSGDVDDSDKMRGPWDIEYRFLARPEIPWDSLPFRDPVTGTFTLKKVRFKNGQGPYIGRSKFDRLYS